jgi:TolB-like protein
MRTLIGLAVAAMAIAFGGLYWFWNSPDVPLARPNPASSATADDGARRVKGKPTIAVLPFVDRGQMEKRAYFSDGITEDIISEFGRFSNLLVLSWNAVAPYKGKSVALDQLSRDLNVRYVVGGTVRQTGDQFVITVQLTDARRGILLWSERYARRLDEIFAVQDEIARNVVAALSIRLTRLEQQRVFRKATDSLDAYDHVLRGRSLMRRVVRDANLDARKMFQKAIDSDPNYGVAYVDLGWSYMNDFLYGWSEWPIRALNRSRELAEHAIRLDERNASAHGLLAQVLTFQREFKSAKKEVEQAIRLNPNNATNHAIKGGLLMWLGDTKAAVSALELALRLDPHPRAMWVANLAQCYYFERRYKESIRLLERFPALFKEDGTIFALLAAANGQLGQLEHAAQALEKLRRVSPFFDATVYAANFVDHQNGRHFLEGLEKAGWKADTASTGGDRQRP